MDVETTEDAIRIAVDLPVPPQRAWALLTEKLHITNWWGDHVDLHARPAGTFLERRSDGGRQVVTAGEVTRCDPPVALKMTWADDDWPGATRVAFCLSEHGAGTRLTLDHSGWRVHPAARRQTLIQDLAGGWCHHLTRLVGYATDAEHHGEERRHARKESGMTTIDANAAPTQTFDWGVIKWLVAPGQTPGAAMTFGEVVLLPGMGHDRHNHPESEEILYVLSGEGEQMLDDGAPFPVRAGDTIYVPTAQFHSTRNTGWAPMRLLAIYNPGGPEQVLTGLPDYQEVPAGEPPALRRG